LGDRFAADALFHCHPPVGDAVFPDPQHAQGAARSVENV